MVPGTLPVINGYDFLAKARALRPVDNMFFHMEHLTWNERTRQTDGVRVVRRCRLRAALPKERVKPHPDLFLPYIDLSLAPRDQNRVCRKRMVRYVAFPPDFVLHKVDWFNKSDNLKPLGV